MQTKTKAQRVLADGSEISEIESYLDRNSPDGNNKDVPLYGIAEDKKCDFVSVESFQNFLFDSEINGTEATLS